MIISQKAQLALSRIRKELSALSDIKLDASGDGSTGTCIIYKAETLSANYRIIRYNSSTGELEYLSSAACATCACPSVGGNTLADSLDGSTSISYYANDNSGTEITFPLSTSYSASDIGAIKVTLGFRHIESSLPKTFTITVSPRNNKNLNAPGFAS